MRISKLNYKSISHKEQRYNTTGDYWFDKNKTLQVRVSRMDNGRYEMLVLVHELIELILCHLRKIKFKDIDNFDINFEKERKKGLHNKYAMPGGDKKAPYYKEHQFATKLEKLLAKKLEVNWKEYEKKRSELRCK